MLQVMMADWFLPHPAREEVNPIQDGKTTFTESEFVRFYERTAPMLRAYFRRSTGRADVDDLLQDAYLRFIRNGLADVEFAQQKSYLYKIAASVLTDLWRRSGRATLTDIEAQHGLASRNPDLAAVHDVNRAMRQLNDRERQMLWLAYVEGAGHREIAESLGLRESSMKSMLFRARQKLLSLVGGKVEA